MPRRPAPRALLALLLLMAPPAAVGQEPEPDPSANGPDAPEDPQADDVPADGGASKGEGEDPAAGADNGAAGKDGTWAGTDEASASGGEDGGAAQDGSAAKGGTPEGGAEGGTMDGGSKDGAPAGDPDAAKADAAGKDGGDASDGKGDPAAGKGDPSWVPAEKGAGTKDPGPGPGKDGAEPAPGAGWKDSSAYAGVPRDQVALPAPAARPELPPGVAPERAGEPFRTSELASAAALPGPLLVPPPPPPPPGLLAGLGSFLGGLGNALGGFFGGIFNAFSAPRIPPPPPPRAGPNLSNLTGAYRMARIAAAEGTVVVAWISDAGSPGQFGVSLVVSRDGGASFGEPQAVGARSWYVDHLRLAAAGSDVHLAWIGHAGPALGKELYYAVSRDRGATFEVRSLSNAASDSDQPWLAVGRTGAHLVWVETSLVPLVPGVVLYRNPTLPAPSTLSTDLAGSAQPRVAAGGDKVWAVWEQARAGPEPRKVFLAQSPDGGRTWRWPAERIWDNYGPQYNPSIAADAQRVHWTWEADYPVPMGGGRNVYRYASARSLVDFEPPGDGRAVRWTGYEGGHLNAGDGQRLACACNPAAQAGMAAPLGVQVAIGPTGQPAYAWRQFAGRSAAYVAAPGAPHALFGGDVDEVRIAYAADALVVVLEEGVGQGHTGEIYLYAPGRGFTVDMANLSGSPGATSRDPDLATDGRSAYVVWVEEPLSGRANVHFARRTLR